MDNDVPLHDYDRQAARDGGLQVTVVVAGGPYQEGVNLAVEQPLDQLLLDGRIIARHPGHQEVGARASLAGDGLREARRVRTVQPVDDESQAAGVRPVRTKRAASSRRNPKDPTASLTLRMVASAPPLAVEDPRHRLSR